MVGQWFPKLARLEPDGSWARMAFHRGTREMGNVRIGDFGPGMEMPGQGAQSRSQDDADFRFSRGAIRDVGPRRIDLFQQPRHNPFSFRPIRADLAGVRSRREG